MASDAPVRNPTAESDICRSALIGSINVEMTKRSAMLSAYTAVSRNSTYQRLGSVSICEPKAILEGCFMRRSVNNYARTWTGRIGARGRSLRLVAVRKRIQKRHDVLDVGLAQCGLIAKVSIEGSLGIDIVPILLRQIVEFQRDAIRPPRVPLLRLRVPLGVKAHHIFQPMQ